MDLGMAASPASAAKREDCLKVRHDLKYYSLVICAELLKEQSNGTKIVAAPGLLCAPLTGLAKISIVSYLLASY